MDALEGDAAVEPQQQEQRLAGADAGGELSGTRGGLDHDRITGGRIHRGAAGHEPENTIRSVCRALEMGAGGVEIDLTAEQFGPDEAIQAPTVVTVPEAPPSRAGEQYALLRRRVLTALDLDPDERRLDPDEQAFPGNRTATS